MQTLKATIRFIINIPWLIAQAFKIFVWQRFTGHDIFISYSRADGFLFANKLANELAKKKFNCFIDQWENEPGGKLSEKLKRRLKNSRMLVVLGTDGALNSLYIKEEIEISLERKKQITPVGFGDIEKACWYPLIKGLPISTVPDFNASNYEIDSHLVERISSSFNHVKRLKLLNVSYGVLFFLLLIGFVSVVYMRDQVQEQKRENKQRFNDLWNLSSRVYNREREIDTIAARSARQTSKSSCESEIKRLEWSIEMKEKFVEGYKKLLELYKKEHKKCPCINEKLKEG